MVNGSGRPVREKQGSLEVKSEAISGTTQAPIETRHINQTHIQRLGLGLINLEKGISCIQTQE
jgi:hypothetical protein